MWRECLSKGHDNRNKNGSEKNLDPVCELVIESKARKNPRNENTGRSLVGSGVDLVSVLPEAAGIVLVLTKSDTDWFSETVTDTCHNDRDEDKVLKHHLVGVIAVPAEER